MYLLMSVRPETRCDKTRQDFSCERSTTGHVTELKRSSPEEYRTLNGRVPDKERIKRSNNG